jgi:hypothetical protein
MAKGMSDFKAGVEDQKLNTLASAEISIMAGAPPKYILEKNWLSST